MSGQEQFKTHENIHILPETKANKVKLAQKMSPITFVHAKRLKKQSCCCSAVV